MSSDKLDPVFFETLFRSSDVWDDVPPAFAIVTGHAPTGMTWPAAQNAAANRRLRDALHGVPWVRAVTGFSPTTEHAEESWAAAMSFDDACDLGRRFKQIAIYYVEGDTLFVSFCDERRALVTVGPFRERLSLVG